MFEIITHIPISLPVPSAPGVTSSNKTAMSLANQFEDGEWMYEKFDDFIWNNIVEAALNHEERTLLEGKSRTLLRRAASQLRLLDLASGASDVGAGSELAEVVLYGVMKNFFGALPAVPKIYYKQNRNDYAKGADSVHIVLSGEDFSFWFGEAKFYKSIEDARLTTVIDSVVSSLGVDKLKREIGIMLGVNEVDNLGIDPLIAEKIKEKLRSPSIDLIRPLFNVPILLLHECEITAAETELTDDYKNKMRLFHTDRAESYFRKQLERRGDVHMYDRIKFHLILIPVPNKERIVSDFMSEARAQRGGHAH